ncbi:MAG: hypothetical protein J0H68_05845 [Sphingobacteriia bacterium]|nr:hypothetical protein [Sphingobacteriia bacterium]
MPFFSGISLAFKTISGFNLPSFVNIEETCSASNCLLSLSLFATFSGYFFPSVLLNLLTCVCCLFFKTNLRSLANY